MQDQQDSFRSVIGLFARLYWMLAGNATMVFLLAFILQKHSKFPSVFDLVYWLIALSLVLVRYLDIRYLDGQTATGEPATMVHWGRYVSILIPAALIAWILARVLEALLR